MATITLNIPERLAPIIDELGDQLPLVLEMGVSRLAPISTRAYIEAVDLLTQEPSPEGFIALGSAIKDVAMPVQLLARSSGDELSLAEEIELDRFGQLEERLQLVKARALIELNR